MILNYITPKDIILLEEWPVKSDLAVPLDTLPENLKVGMGEAWPRKKKNRKILEGTNR